MSQPIIDITTNYKQLDQEFTTIGAGIDVILDKIQRINSTVIKIGTNPETGYRQIIQATNDLAATQDSLKGDIQKITALYVQQQKAVEAKAKADKALADQKRSELKLAQDEARIIGNTTDAIEKQTDAIDANVSAIEERNGITIKQPVQSIATTEIGAISVQQPQIKPVVELSSIKELNALIQQAAINADNLANKYGKDSAEALQASESVTLLRNRLADINALIKGQPKQLIPAPATEDYATSINKASAALTENNSLLIENRKLQSTVSDASEYKQLQVDEQKLIQSNEQLSTSLTEQIAQYKGVDDSVLKLNADVTELIAKSEQLRNDQSKPLVIAATSQTPAQGNTTGTVVSDSEKEKAAIDNEATAQQALNKTKQDATIITNQQSEAVSNSTKTLTESEASVMAFTELIRANVSAQKENSAQIAANAKETASINAAIEKQGSATAAQNERLLQLKASTILLNSQNKTLTTSTNQITKEFVSESGSIDQLRAKVTQLTTQYDALSTTEKKSTFGTGIKSKLDLLVPALKQAEAETGRFQKSVGDYAGGIQKYASTAYSFLRQAAILIPGIGIQGIVAGIADAVVSFIGQLDLFESKTSLLNDAISGTDEKSIHLRQSLQELGTSATEIAEGALKQLTEATKQLETQLGNTPTALETAGGAIDVLKKKSSELFDLYKAANQGAFGVFNKIATLGLSDAGLKAFVIQQQKGINKEIDKINKESADLRVAQEQDLRNRLGDVNNKEGQDRINNEIAINNKLISNQAESFAKRIKLTEDNAGKQKQINKQVNDEAIKNSGGDEAKIRAANEARTAADVTAERERDEKVLDLRNQQTIAENNLTLKGQEARESLEQSANDRVLNNDKSYFGDKLSALKDNLTSQQKLIQDSLQNTLSNPTLSSEDKQAAVIKANADAFKSQQDYLQQVQKINAQISSDTTKNFSFRYQAEKAFYSASISLIDNEESKGVLSVTQAFDAKKDAFSRYIKDIRDLQKQEVVALSQRQEINPTEFYTKQLAALESYHKRALITDEKFAEETSRITSEINGQKSFQEQQTIKLEQQKTFNEQYTKLITDATNAQNTIIDIASAKEAAKAKEDYDNNLITLAEFEDNKADIVNKYQKQQLQNQIQQNIALQTNANVDVNSNHFSEYAKSIEGAVKAVADLGNTSQETKKFSDELAKSVQGQIDNYENLASGVAKGSSEYDRYKKIISELKDLLKALGVEIKNVPNDIDKTSKQFDNLINTLQSLAEITQSLGSAFTDLAGIDISNQQTDLEEIGAQQDKNYEQEQENIQKSTRSEKDKEIALNNLEKQHNADQEENQRKQKEYDNQKAEFDRDANIGNIITGTLASAAKAGFITPIGIAIEIAGAAALIKALATKIPHYWTGLTYDKPDHIGLHGDVKEIVAKPGEVPFLSTKPVIDFIPTGTRITPVTNEYVTEIMNRQQYFTTTTMPQPKYEIKVEAPKTSVKNLIKPVVSRRDIRAVSNEMALRIMMDKHKYR